MNPLASGWSEPGHFRSHTPLALESGGVLENPTITYRSWGTLRSRRDNAILVCHALTGSDDVDHWWFGMIGAGRALDPARDYILCTNVLGSCYGTTGPATINPETGLRYGSSFPVISVADMVMLQRQLGSQLGQLPFQKHNAWPSWPTPAGVEAIFHRMTLLLRGSRQHAPLPC